MKDRLQSNEKSAIEACNKYLETRKTQDNTIINSEFANSDLTKALEQLHNLKDARDGIFCSVQEIENNADHKTKVKIRDARNVKDPIELDAPEIFAIQIINHTRAAISIIEESNVEDSSKIIQDLKEMALQRAKEVVNESQSDFTTRKKQVEEFNTTLMQQLTDLDIENPEKQMKYAKEYVSFQDEHYHIATIYNVRDSSNKEHQVIELDVMVLGLTNEQKEIFSHINNTEIDQIRYPWFNSLNQWE
jgi:hypothetical protein